MEYLPVTDVVQIYWASLHTITFIFACVDEVLNACILSKQMDLVHCFFIAPWHFVFDICAQQIGHIGVCCAVVSPLVSVKGVSA